jgi:hypothetical protein
LRRYLLGFFCFVELHDRKQCRSEPHVIISPILVATNPIRLPKLFTLSVQVGNQPICFQDLEFVKIKFTLGWPAIVKD